MTQDTFNKCINDGMKLLMENFGSMHVSEFYSALQSVVKIELGQDQRKKIVDTLIQFDLIYFIANENKAEERLTLTKTARLFISYEREIQKLEDAEDVKKIDTKVKKMNLKGYKTQQILSFCALGIALFSSMISLITYFKKSDIQVRDWNRLIENQQKIEQAIIHLNHADSLR